MRKLNVKILVILLAVVFTLTAGAAFILYIRSNESAQWLATARTAEKAGDYDTAVENYLLYLSENRDNQEILCEAAIVGNQCVDEDHIADSKQAMTALRLMARALRSSSDRTDIRRNLARGLISAGRLARGSDSERTFYAESEKQIGKHRSQKVNDAELDFPYAQCV